MLCFSNPGEIDPRLVTTLGVNVKEGASPIGYFGTGLKYAIAGLLRLGHSIEIHSGLRRFTFELEEEVIRGKAFSFIMMREEGPRSAILRLGYTTELGKNWQPWQFYRELASNAIDEGGASALVKGLRPASPGQTSIYVTGLDEIHYKRGEIFLADSTPLASGEEIQFFPSTSPSLLFYRGVRVGQMSRPSLFTYNVLSTQELTEDRTIASMWSIEWDIAKAIIRLENASMIKAILLAPEASFEASLDFNRSIEGKVFDQTTEELMKDHLGRMNFSAIRRIEGRRSKARPTPLVPSPVESRQLARALEFLAKRLSITISAPIHLAESLGSGVQGLAKDGEIFIAREAFGVGTKRVAVVLVEEWLHAERGYRDFSREFQTWVLEKCVSLGEELGGEPL